jgi:hypothetical protein
MVTANEREGLIGLYVGFFSHGRARQVQSCLAQLLRPKNKEEDGSDWILNTTGKVWYGHHVDYLSLGLDWLFFPTWQLSLSLVQLCDRRKKKTLVFRRLHTRVCLAYLDPWHAGVCSVCFG